MRQQLFFELIQVSLGTRICLSHTPSADEWGKLYDIAKKQSLVGVCFAGVQKLASPQPSPEGKGVEQSHPSGGDLEGAPPEMLYLTWMGMAAKIQQRNEVVNRQCVELQAKLSADGFRSYIMKGQAVASLYKVHNSKNCGECSRAGSDPAREKTVENHEESSSLQMLRQSGDIDVYLEGGLDKVLAYARSFGVVAKVNELEMSVPVFQDTEVEFHYRPFIMRNPWKNKRLQKFFDECAEENFNNTLNLSNQLNHSEPLTIVAPTTEFNLVHQLAHIHLHLFTEGIGMRQLMDYYFVLRDFRTKTGKTASVSAESHIEPLANDSSAEIENKLSSSAYQSSATLSGSADTSAKNIKNIIEVVTSLGLERFASAVMWVLGYVFGMVREYMLWEPNEEDGRLLLSEVMQSGNFGHNDEVLNHRKQKKGYSVWALFFRNLKFARFDRGDWFWGPLWRITHKITNLKFKIK